MGRIETDGGFWLVLGLMVLLLPLRFLAGVILAAAVHEAGHLLAIRWTGSRVLRLELHSGGARIVTDPMEPGQEILCALAGPAAGALTTLAWGCFPELALAGAVQTVFNLLPLGELDGGRALDAFMLILRRESG